MVIAIKIISSKNRWGRYINYLFIQVLYSDDKYCLSCKCSWLSLFSDKQWFWKGALKAPLFIVVCFYILLLSSLIHATFHFYLKLSVNYSFTKKASCRDVLGAEWDLSISTSKCRKLHLWAVEFCFICLLSYWQNNFSVCKRCIIRWCNGSSEILLWQFKSMSMGMLESCDTWCSLFPFLAKDCHSSFFCC